ncbi:hypothetical protein VB735_17380 [Halotia wernerae UHCC 0503]|nr:hypothetical protein [Halotia wernerae UHCC 0503]
MQIRLAAQVASKVEGVRLSLNYSKLSDTVNLLLDAIRHEWDLKIVNLSFFETEETRVRLDQRHYEWLSQYGESRGINIVCVTNLLISEYLLGNQMKELPQKQEVVVNEPDLIPQAQKTKTPDSKPKGQQLIRGLKL